jgi:hypothetical protein
VYDVNCTGPVDNSQTRLLEFTDPIITVDGEIPIKVAPKDSYGNEVDIADKLVLLNTKEACPLRSVQNSASSATK